MNERSEKIVVLLFAARAFLVMAGVGFFVHQSDFSLQVAGLPVPARPAEHCEGQAWATSECLAAEKAEKQRSLASVPVVDPAAEDDQER